MRIPRPLDMSCDKHSELRNGSWDVQISGETSAEDSPPQIHVASDMTRGIVDKSTIVVRPKYVCLVTVDGFESADVIDVNPKKCIMLVSWTI